ncbi:MAG: heavy metal-binding domain-containing protein [Verrucomicrobiaceae bacterium]
MKTIKVWMMMLACAALVAAPLRAEEPAKESKCAKKPEMEKKMEAMEAKMKAEAAEFDKLIDAMNTSIGDKKIEAMAAVINKMAQKQKEMKAKCDAMMKGGMDMGKMKKDGKAEAKPAGKTAPEYYTCTMHPAVRSPGPGKCPICFVGEIGPYFGFNRGAPNLGPRLTVLSNKGEVLSDQGHLDAAEVVEVARVELQEHRRALRLGGGDHAQRHLQVGDVEPRYRVAPALGGGEQFVRPCKRHEDGLLSDLVTFG